MLGIGDKENLTRLAAKGSVIVYHNHGHHSRTKHVGGCSAGEPFITENMDVFSSHQFTHLCLEVTEEELRVATGLQQNPDLVSNLKYTNSFLYRRLMNVVKMLDAADHYNIKVVAIDCTPEESNWEKRFKIRHQYQKSKVEALLGDRNNKMIVLLGTLHYALVVELNIPAVIVSHSCEKLASIGQYKAKYKLDELAAANNLSILSASDSRFSMASWQPTTSSINLSQAAFFVVGAVSMAWCAYTAATTICEGDEEGLPQRLFCR